MPSSLWSCLALGALAFVTNAAVHPTAALAADDDEPTVTPYGLPTRPPPQQQPPPAATGAPAVSVPTTVTPPAGSAPPPAPPAPAQPSNASPAPVPPHPAPAPSTGYPPPGSGPYGQYPAYRPAVLTQVHRPRRGLVTGGAVTFGVSWGIAATVSFLLSSSTCGGDSCNSADYLWIPFAGPLIVGGSSNDAGVFILWSATEVAGAIMLIVGIVGHDVTEYRLVRGGPTLQLTPLFARDASGMALTARW
jgi:hypothetical protein